MKKILLASVLAGLAGVAQAQSSVTLYGLVDLGFRNDKTDGVGSTNGIQSGNQAQSRWGMRGTEDLGNGISAIFTIEGGVLADDGTQVGGRLFNRATYLGLQSKTLGMLRVGRFTHLGFEWAAAVANPFGLGFGRSSVGSTFAYNDAEFGAGRVSNAAYYYSPVMGGFQGAVGYSFQTTGTEVAGAGNNNRMMDAGLRYNAGPLRLVATYQYAKPTASGARPKNLTLGAAYDLGPLVVHAGYARLRDSTGSTFGVADDNAYSLGLSAPIGAGRLYAAYQRATGSDMDNWALGYTYDLSKRTNLYAYFNTGDTTTGSVAARTGQRQLALGMVHRF